MRGSFFAPGRARSCGHASPLLSLLLIESREPECLHVAVGTCERETRGLVQLDRCNIADQDFCGQIGMHLLGVLHESPGYPNAPVRLIDGFSDERGRPFMT